ncbi:MAG: glycoside hydrolase family 3 C-terminal domain-containing protein [Clostridia bacterium]|nr:glycoside hydrolase family 3 C-terminal domain-containing protein [Deltaproteobacteria bacterium]
MRLFHVFFFAALILVVPRAASARDAEVEKACASIDVPALGEPMDHRAVEHCVDVVLRKMTLVQKIGQLTKYTWGSLTGPAIGLTGGYDELIARGEVGSIFNVADANLVQSLQRVARDHSPLGVPLLFGYDTIHGYRTVYPVPLALAGTFDVGLAQQAARLAGRETAFAGIDWTYAPMVDIARDARWGRIVESFGEDPLLSSRMAAAQVRGYRAHVMSTAKHFVGYGAAESGRDYATVDMSREKLFEIYLPSFKAAVDAGTDTIMTSFNDLNGMPMHASKWLVRDLLRGEWGWEGIVCSDYGGIGELVPHGIAANRLEAGKKALEATVDVDMQSAVYAETLGELVQRGQVDEKLIDSSVRRVLRAKIAMNGWNRNRTPQVPPPLDRQFARESGQRSIVLLKNEGVLPIDESRVKRIALIGPLADSRVDMLGPWHGQGRPEDVVTIFGALAERVSRDKLTMTYSPGIETRVGADEDTADPLERAVNDARAADLVIAVVGESEQSSGEAASKTWLGLSRSQEQLVRAVQSTGTPVVVVLVNGRPLALPWVDDSAAAVVESWHLGIEHGHSVIDILWGDALPSAKLAITVPRAVGQEPLYYGMRSSGRPLQGEDSGKLLVDYPERYFSRYIDEKNAPLYPFGYGLTYTRFEIDAPELSSRSVTAGDVIDVKVHVTNVGDRPGSEVVQIYIHDNAASVTRPLKQLIDFVRVELASKESRDVVLHVPVKELAIHDANGVPLVEPGTFTLWAGSSAASGMQTTFEVTP